MKKLLAAVMASGLLFGGAAVAHAAGNAGPNGNNDHGLCTAYFNGQKKGWGEGNPPGFDDLVAAADEAGNGDGTASPSEVYDYCLAYGIGGNPAHGRYPGCFDGDQNGNGDPCDDTAA